jgi:hypothetical protein
MWEFTVTENSVVRQFRPRSGSLSEQGSKSSNDLHPFIKPIAAPYDYIFRDEIAKKGAELAILNKATKLKLDVAERLGVRPEATLRVHYEVNEKGEDGVEVSKTRYCIWQEINTNKNPHVEFYYCNRSGNPIGVPKIVEGVSNFNDLHKIFKYDDGSLQLVADRMEIDDEHDVDLDDFEEQIESSVPLTAYESDSDSCYNPYVQIIRT